MALAPMAIHIAPVRPVWPGLLAAKIPPKRLLRILRKFGVSQKPFLGPGMGLGRHMGTIESTLVAVTCTALVSNSPRGCHKDAHPLFFLLWHPLSDVWWLPTNRHRLHTNRHRLPTNRHRLPTGRHRRAYWTLQVYPVYLTCITSPQHLAPSGSWHAQAGVQAQSLTETQTQAYVGRTNTIILFHTPTLPDRANNHSRYNAVPGAP